MSFDDITHSSGVIGCLDPSGARVSRLADWCQGRGVEPLLATRAFALWSNAHGRDDVHPLSINGLQGVLVGHLFLPTGARRSAPAEGSVAEQVSASYRTRGIDAVFDLDGQFSLSLWDPRRRELFLYRDATAARSLYLSQLDGDALVFSDDLDLLVKSPLVEKRLCRPSIHEFLRFLDISPPNCIYEDVTSAEPGVLYRMGRGLSPQRARPSESPQNPPASLAEATDQLEALLKAAVTERMSPSGQTIAFLSGGVDSSLLCALAARHAPERVKAITVGFEDADFDESKVAVKVAQHLGIEHQVLGFSMSTYRGGFERLAAGIAYPSADPAGLPTLLSFEVAGQTATCALDGTGADTLFGVMPARHQRLAVELGTLLPRPLRRLATRLLTRLPGLRGYAPLVDFDDPEEVLIRWRGWSRRELEHLCGEPVSLSHTRFYQQFRTFPRDAHLDRYSTLLGGLPDDRIHQAAQLTGLDVRLPYVDRSVTDWVEGLRVDLRFHPDEPKRVLKAVLERHVPRRLWDHPKHGFDFPFLRLMKADDYALVRRYLDPAVTSPWGLFEETQIQASKEALIGADNCSAFSANSPAFRTWALVVLFAWLEHHCQHV
jgi:asparagine synthase (glutamine-hydrolysing)